MERICQDCFTIIFEFLTDKELVTIENTHKDIVTDYSWKVIGLRDHPKLNIQNKIDYYCKNPLFVSETRLINDIQENPWSKQLYDMKVVNRNNKEDHLYKAYIRDIMKCMAKVHNLREFYKEYRKTETTQWGMAVQILIDDILTQSEESANDMKEHQKNQIENTSRNRFV